MRLKGFVPAFLQSLLVPHPEYGLVDYEVQVVSHVVCLYAIPVVVLLFYQKHHIAHTWGFLACTTRPTANV